jgi:hypothetical protein
MAQPAFNPTHEVSFDLEQGRISLGGSAGRVLVPADALASLARSAGGDALVDFGRSLGTEIGRRAAARLVGGPDAASTPSVVEHLGGDLALAGLGSLSIERWSRVLVLRMSGSPFGAEGDALLAAVLEGAIQRGLGRDAAVVPLERSDGSARFLAVNATAAESVKDWLAEGVSWGEILSRLNAS